MLLVIASTLLLSLLVLAGTLLLMSPGKPAPLLDAGGQPLKGSVSEKIYVEINGIRQGMFIKSTDATHPVLLFVHGDMPFYFFTGRYPPGSRIRSRSSGGSSVARASRTAPTFLARR